MQHPCMIDQPLQAQVALGTGKSLQHSQVPCVPQQPALLAGHMLATMQFTQGQDTAPLRCHDQVLSCVA